VFITGGHSHWLTELQYRFQKAGLEGVKFFTITQVLNGDLRGRRGLLLIDDEVDIPNVDLRRLWEVQHYMNAVYGVRN
jgi:hypothetical protein